MSSKFCSALSQTESKKKTWHSYSNDRNQNPKAKKYAYTVLGLGAGVVIGSTLKTIYEDLRSTDRLVQRVIPSVCAASPFSIGKIGDDNKNVGKSAPPTSKRLVYNFIADAVEKASDKVVNIDIKDKRGYVKPFFFILYSITLTVINVFFQWKACIT